MINNLRKELKLKEVDEKDFMYNIQYKGLYLVNHIYESFKKFNTYVEWDIIFAAIQFDKELRNNLYKFLGTIEEYMKTKLFNEYDVDNKDIVFDSQKHEKKCKDALKKKDSTYSSNLYYVFQLNFKPLIDIVKEKSLFDESYCNALERVREIRNKVMHHSVLILGSAITKIDIIHQINEVKIGIESMYQTLPKQFKEGFEISINNLSDKYDIKDLKLGVMENGIFK